MIITSGVDVGSSAVKVAIVASPEGSGRGREGAEVLSCFIERTRRRDQREVVDLAYRRALEEAKKTREDIAYIATTGEGELVDFRTGHFYGMTAHARGALFLEPRARAALDVGALHGRAIRFDERGRVLGYRMTSQCASGSGQFLENIARYLGVSIDEIGSLSKKGDAPEKVSGICAVLAETDVINMVSRGITTSNILRGIHDSMANRFVKLLRSAKADGVVLISGGLGLDEGLLSSLSHAVETQKLANIEIRAHKSSVFAGAIGAALWGAYRYERLQQKEAA